ncbi:tyrosine-type recombinase/integrase [Ohessyouella blattaphilus]|uniref:Tyrosine-type recombinase/integrase n=1 Tax=Ohessyouella blattaphilus TaxID=2949333 RepID=A0ABT1ELC6_9FIRM|nr:tyrosine-type recombinase/integrase [Ohessyouella blattaphilus]MCP1111493.1 tyrosine-type recombinase/integrase [Ohessyouella blattaphilus]MCR8564887.1 tyrosine-type recombinase/integrase [Ohessyouella blattaphilus]
METWNMETAANKLVLYRESLCEEEKSKATIEKYERDVRKFLKFLDGRCETLGGITKSMVVEYKEELLKGYEGSSVNSMLAAVNNYLYYISKGECRVKQIRIQKIPYIDDEKCLSVEEYKSMVNTAREEGKERLAMILETLGSTGLRVSELSDITLERLKSGVISIHNKGKVRTIAMTKDLRKKLLRYAKSHKVLSGPIFVTKSGKSVDRSNLWREIQRICKRIGIALKKAFPHNLRHMFAMCYYKIEKDIVGLSEFLGHNSIETTKIYTKGSYTNFIRKLEKMNRTIQ